MIWTPRLIALSNLTDCRLWIKFVAGFDPYYRGQKCLIGWTMPAIQDKIVPGVPVGLGPCGPGTRPPLTGDRSGRYDAIFVGGTVRGRRVAIAAVPDPFGSFAVEGVFRVDGVRSVPIPNGTGDPAWLFGGSLYGIKL